MRRKANLTALIWKNSTVACTWAKKWLCTIFSSRRLHVGLLDGAISIALSTTSKHRPGNHIHLFSITVLRSMAKGCQTWSPIKVEENVQAMAQGAIKRMMLVHNQVRRMAWRTSSWSREKVKPFRHKRCSPWWQPMDVTYYWVFSWERKWPHCWPPNKWPAGAEMACRSGGDGKWCLETNDSE